MDYMERLCCEVRVKALSYELARLARNLRSGALLEKKRSAAAMSKAMDHAAWRRSIGQANRP